MLNRSNNPKRIGSRTHAVLFAFHANAIRAATRAGQHMLLSSNRTLRPDDLREELQLRAAKYLAGSRRRANPATIFQQQPVAPVFVQLRHSTYATALAQQA